MADQIGDARLEALVCGGAPSNREGRFSLMLVNSTLEERFRSYVENRRDRLVEIIRDLVRIPSENTPLPDSRNNQFVQV